MANDKYVKLIKQYSEDGGNTWYDSNPPEYKRGDLIETDSPDCGATPIIYRWYALPNDYICEGVNKYYKEVYQQSNNGGLTWENVIPYQERVGELIESNSIDCQTTWEIVDNEYICDIAPLSDCFITFSLDGYNIFFNSENSTSQDDTILYSECRDSSTIEGRNIRSLDITNCGSYTYRIDIYNNNTATKLTLKKPDFINGLNANSSISNACNISVQAVSDVNWDFFVEAPNRTYIDIIGTDKGYYRHGVLGLEKAGGYEYMLFGGIILPYYMINNILYNSLYPCFSPSNFENGNIVLTDFDYRKSRVGTDTFSRYSNYLIIAPDKNEFVTYTEAKVNISNFNVVDYYVIDIEYNNAPLIRKMDYVTIDGVYQKKLFGGEYLYDPEGIKNDRRLNSALVLNIDFTKELILKNIDVEYFYMESIRSDGEKHELIDISIKETNNNDEVRKIYFENCNLPSEYVEWGMNISPQNKNVRCEVHIKNCSQSITQMVQDAKNKSSLSDNITIIND